MGLKDIEVTLTEKQKLGSRRGRKKNLLGLIRHGEETAKMFHEYNKEGCFPPEELAQLIGITYQNNGDGKKYFIEKIRRLTNLGGHMFPSHAISFGEEINKDGVVVDGSVLVWVDSRNLMRVEKDEGIIRGLRGGTHASLYIDEILMLMKGSLSKNAKKLFADSMRRSPHAKKIIEKNFGVKHRELYKEIEGEM